MADSKMPEKKRKLADLAKVGNMKLDFRAPRDTNKEPNAPPSPDHVKTR